MLVIKKIQKLSILAILLSTITTSRADIPFEEAKGIWQLTKSEYKHISPFWGIAMIHGQLLSILRFFGNYNQAIIEGHEIDRGEEAIAELIRQLFSSPDGRLFVATTYHFNPAGDLSHHLEKMNDIIMALDAYDHQLTQSPQKTETVSVAETENQLKTISDEIKELNSLIVKDPEKTTLLTPAEITEQNNFKALIKEKQDAIKALKGPKAQDPLVTERNTLTKQIQSTTQQIDKLRAAKKQDDALFLKIRGLEATLSTLNTKREVILQQIASRESQTPEKLRFSALEETLYQILEPIGSHRTASDDDIIKEAQAILEKTLSYKADLTDVDVSQKKVVEALKHQTKKTRTNVGELVDDVDWANSLEAQAEDMIANAPERARALVQDYLYKTSEGRSTAKKDKAYLKEMFTHSPERAREFVTQAYQPRIREFAHLIAEAQALQSKLANPKNPKEQVYPEHIVPTVLLAFFAKIADSKSDLKKLPDLFQDPQSIDSLTPYSKKEFHQTTPTEEMMKDPNPELAFLYGRGYEQYVQIILPPFAYRGSTTYLNNPDFPDCGESSLRYILSSLLGMGNGGRILPADLSNLEKNIQSSNPDVNLSQHKSYQAFKKFMLAHGNLGLASIQQYHNDWAEVVSNLNEPTQIPTINDVQYGRGDPQNGLYTYEIKSVLSERGARGIINMLNVIAKLIPDAVLNEPWAENETDRFSQVEEKLNRLCQLFSKPNFKVSWHESAYGEIKNPFVQIDIDINGDPHVSWTFSAGHFSMDKISSRSNDPRIRFDADNKFNSPWIASFYSELTSQTKVTSNFNYYFPHIFSPKINQMENQLGLIIYSLRNAHTFPQFLSYIPRWIAKAFPFTDNNAFITFTDIMIRIFAEKDKIPNFNQLHAKLQKFYKKFRGDKGQTLLFTAVYGTETNSPNLEVIKDLIDAGLDVNAKDEHGKTPLFYIKNLETFNILYENGADVHVKNVFKDNILFNAAQRNDPELVKAIVAKGVDVNAPNASQLIPILFSKTPEVFNAFVDSGANINKTNLLSKSLLQNRFTIILAALDKGANPEMLNDQGTPFYLEFLRKSFSDFPPSKDPNYPTTSQWMEIFEKLKPYYAKSDIPPLLYLMDSNGVFTRINKDKIKIIDDIIALTDVHDEKNKFLLHEAIKKNRLLVLEKLLKKGMNANIKDNEGNTPLHYAFEYQNKEFRDLLFKYGADITIRNKNGKTPEELGQPERGFRQ